MYVSIEYTHIKLGLGVQYAMLNTKSPADTQDFLDLYVVPHLQVGERGVAGVDACKQHVMLGDHSVETIAH